MYIVTVRLGEKDYKIECPTAGAKLKVEGLDRDYYVPIII